MKCPSLGGLVGSLNYLKEDGVLQPVGIIQGVVLWTMESIVSVEDLSMKCPSMEGLVGSLITSKKMEFSFLMEYSSRSASSRVWYYGVHSIC